MKLHVRVRLSAMMFVQFFVWGAWYVTAPSYLGRIGFGAADFGWTYSVGPIAGMISPLFVGIVADRFLAVERVLGVLHLLGGAALLLAMRLMDGPDPSPGAINWALFAHMLCYFPTLALCNSLAMRNMEDSERQFPSIRVLGTIGWIAAGFTLSTFGWGSSIGMFGLAAASAFGLGAYCFTLPHTPPFAAARPGLRELLGLDALVLLRRPAFAVFMASSFLICIPLAFYYQMAERAVQAGGLTNTPSKMAFGQVSEIFFLLVMPLFFARLGVKWMLFLGMLAWVVRYALFSVGVPDQVAWMLMAGIVLHGICYDFFFVTGQIYTDQTAPGHIRSQAQGLLVLCTLGLGMFGGAQLAGQIEAAATPPEATRLADQAAAVHAERERLAAAAGALDGMDAATRSRLEVLEQEENRLALEHLRHIDWGAIWRLPAIGAGVIMLLFALFFRPARGRSGV